MSEKGTGFKQTHSLDYFELVFDDLTQNYLKIDATDHPFIMSDFKVESESGV